MSKVKAYGAQSATSPLAPLDIERRPLAAEDVQIDILYCGVCHSDLHTARNEWKNTIYPSVPGHEIVGRITAVGSNVTQFKVGDLAGVGCMVDSCGHCHPCAEGEEQYCESGFTVTYNGPVFGGENTYGGYSQQIVVKQSFVLHVTLFTTSAGKVADAKRLAADEVCISSDPEQMAKYANQLDFILNTVAAPHALDTYMQLLKKDATMTLVGAPDRPHPGFEVFSLIFKRRHLAGSLIGGIAETQEMLDFCAKHGIVSDIEMIPMQDINTAYERMLKSDVKYRFVVDMASLK